LLYHTQREDRTLVLFLSVSPVWLHWII